MAPTSRLLSFSVVLLHKDLAGDCRCLILRFHVPTSVVVSCVPAVYLDREL